MASPRAHAAKEPYPKLGVQATGKLLRSRVLPAHALNNGVLAQLKAWHWSTEVCRRITDRNLPSFLIHGSLGHQGQG